MLPWTRGLRKEFLPLYDRGEGAHPVLKPVAHHVLETMVDAGITDITLVVGAKDRSFVRNYFTIDREFLARHAHHRDRLRETERFYRTLGWLRLRFAVQPAPRGFGDATLRAERYVRGGPFVLHAADAVLLEPHRGAVLHRMADRVAEGDVDAVLLVRRVKDPRRYGVVEGTAAGTWEGMRRLRVTGMEEKPEHPRSSWAATAVYAFSPRLFQALHGVVRQGRPRELEVTDAIRWLLAHGGRVEAFVLSPAFGQWCSVGSPEGFVRALRRTHRRALMGGPSLPPRGRAKD